MAIVESNACTSQRTNPLPFNKNDVGSWPGKATEETRHFWAQVVRNVSICRKSTTIIFHKNILTIEDTAHLPCFIINI